MKKLHLHRLELSTSSGFSSGHLTSLQLNEFVILENWKREIFRKNLSIRKIIFVSHKVTLILLKKLEGCGSEKKYSLPKRTVVR